MTVSSDYVILEDRNKATGMELTKANLFSLLSEMDIEIQNSKSVVRIANVRIFG